MDPSYLQRLTQITRSEWELAKGRICLNTFGNHVIYKTQTPRDAHTLHTGMKCETVNKNDNRVIGIFDRTAVGVVEDNIFSNGQSRSGKGWLNASPLIVTRFLINDRFLRQCPSAVTVTR